MAIFGTKKKIEDKVETKTASKPVKAVKTVKAPVVKSAAPVEVAPGVRPDVIVRPRITEKAGIQNEKLNVYTFEVSKAATKHSIAHAMKSIYKVTPEKVRIVNLPDKPVFRRGKVGTQSGIKKAFVYLKKGDKIDVV